MALWPKFKTIFQICHDTHEDICHTIQKTKCDYEEKEVCETAYQKSCSHENKQECFTHIEKVCTNSHVHQVCYLLCPVLGKTYLGAKRDFEIWAFKVFFSLDTKSTP